ncbi:MAG: hypothetical protein AAGJ51_12575, partial [Pseudomonadota bacterium]
MLTKPLKFALAAAALFIPSLFSANADTIQFEGYEWTAGEADGSAARVERYLDRDALFLRRNLAVIE